MQVSFFVRGAENCPKTAQPNMTVGRDITFKVKIRDHHIRKDGTCAIYIQCFAKGEQIRVPTGLYCSPRDWNKNKQRFRSSHPNADDHNLILEDMIQRIHELRVKSRLGHLRISPDVIREFITESSLSMDFIAYMRWKVEQRKSEIAYNTLRHHRSTLNYLKRFKDPFPFSQINNQSIFKWRNEMKAKGLSKNTIANKVKILKTYLNRAKEDGIIFDYPKRALTISEEKGRRTALSKNQLKRAMELYQFGELSEGASQTLRCFLFSCFTGLRYGDIASLNPDNIIDRYLIVTPQKTRKSTGKHIKIPLSNLAELLIDRNSDKPLGKVLSNQKMNKNLKKIGTYIGIDNITYHMSRHTFATIYLELGGSVHTLKDLLGHSKLELTMVYAHAVDKTKESEIGNFDKALGSGQID